MVQKLCAKHGIPYHTTSFWGGLKEVVLRLKAISQQAAQRASANKLKIS
jgi:hypothetical protein